MREGRFYKFWVYIMASRTGTLYVGMTGFVDTRISQHKLGEMEGFATGNTNAIGWFILSFTMTYMWQNVANGS